MTIEERFWKFVDKDGPIIRPELGPCWVWTGALMRRRYGKFRMSKPRRLVAAHRVSFFLAHGKWPDNDACHHCDNPPCIRPSHLFDGTNLENMQDAARKGRTRNGSAVVFGENHGMAILSADQVVIIRQRRLQGEFLKDIAADYGVRYQTIQAIIEGRRWKLVQTGKAE